MKEWLGLAMRLVVGGVWIVAGALKLPDPQSSVDAVRAYQLLPGEWAVTVGHLLPLLEVVIGVALVLGLVTRVAAGASVVLFAAFVVGIASVWARGIEIDCGCFGGGGAQAGAAAQYPVDLARDVALLAASAWLVWLPRSRWALDAILLGRPDDAPEREHSDDLRTERQTDLEGS